MPMRLLVNTAIFVAFLALSYHIVGVVGVGSGNLFGLQYRGQDVSITAFLAIALATVFGAMLGSVYGYLDKSQAEVPWWTAVIEATRTRRFGMSLLVTPLIVFMVFDQLHTQNVDVGLGLFCLQSGFFWDRTLNVMKQKETSQEAQFNPPPTVSGA